MPPSTPVIFTYFPKFIKTVCLANTQLPPGRPIVADVDTESSRICAYIDFYLKLLSVLHPSYIKDTYDFVKKICNQPVPHNSLLITANVESLYTNMKLDLILKSIYEAFLESPDPFRPDIHLLELLKLTLYYNDFHFDNQFFLQICGIAMGRIYTPSAANIYLKKIYDLATHTPSINPLLYFRFLDDIFGVWPGTVAQLKEYEAHLNTLIPCIKVTFSYNNYTIEFLDTFIYKHTHSNSLTTLQTKVHFKPTDTHQLLHRSSFHPQHTFKSVIKSEFIRFKRISSTYSHYSFASSILIHSLTSRGYNKSLLRKQKLKIWREYKEPPTSRKEQQKYTEIIPIITHFDRHNLHLNHKWASIIRDNPIFQQQQNPISPPPHYLGL